MARLAGDDIRFLLGEDVNGEDLCFGAFGGDNELVFSDSFNGDGDVEELFFGGGGGGDDEFRANNFSSIPDLSAILGSSFSESRGPASRHADRLPQTLAGSDGDLGFILPQLVSTLHLAEEDVDEEEVAGYVVDGVEEFMLSEGWGEEEEGGAGDETLMGMGGLEVVGEVEEEEAAGDEGLTPEELGFVTTELGETSAAGGFRMMVDAEMRAAGGFRMMVDADDTDSDDAADFVQLLRGYITELGGAGGSGGSSLRPRPVPREVVESLPESALSEEEASRGCPVCRDSFVPGQHATWLPCRHYYHGDCIRPWLAIRNNCPVCRFELGDVVSRVTGFLEGVAAQNGGSGATRGAEGATGCPAGNGPEQNAS